MSPQEMRDEIDRLHWVVGNLRSMQRINAALADSLLPDEGQVNVRLDADIARQITTWDRSDPTSAALVDACVEALEQWS